MKRKTEKETLTNVQDSEWTTKPPNMIIGGEA